MQHRHVATEQMTFVRGFIKFPTLKLILLSCIVLYYSLLCMHLLISSLVNGGPLLLLIDYKWDSMSGEYLLHLWYNSIGDVECTMSPAGILCMHQWQQIDTYHGSQKSMWIVYQGSGGNKDISRGSGWHRHRNRGPGGIGPLDLWLLHRNQIFTIQNNPVMPLCPPRLECLSTLLDDFLNCWLGKQCTCSISFLFHTVTILGNQIFQKVIVLSLPCRPYWASCAIEIALSQRAWILQCSGCYKA